MTTDSAVIDQPGAAQADKPAAIPVMAPIHAMDTPAGGAPAGAPQMVQVMEIDPAAPPDVQAREYAEAHEKGLKVVMKGQAPAELVPVEAAKPAASETEDDAPPAHPLSKLFGGEAEAEVVVPEIPAPVAEFFNNNKLGDPKEILSQYPKLKVELDNLRTQNEQAEAQFEALRRLSPEAQNILAQDLDGVDWRTRVRELPNFNYEQPYSKQNLKKVTEAFGGIPLTAEDWEEHGSPDGDPRSKRLVDSAIAVAKANYEKTRDEELSYGQRTMAAAQERQQKERASRDAAVSQLNKVQGSAPYVAKVKSMLTREGILGHFFEKDGVTFKPSAALDLWLLSDRDAVLGTAKAVMAQGVKTAATVGHLRRTEERAAAGTKGGGKQEMTGEQIAKAIFERGIKGR